MPEETGEDSEAELTAASSICQSPGWDDATTKKQKKEKEEARKRKKKEAEKAALKELAQAKAAAKQAEKEKRNRLSKANPANGSSRLSRIGFMMNRSSSMPAVAQPTEHVESRSEDITSSLNVARPQTSMTGDTVPWQTNGHSADAIPGVSTPMSTRSRASSQQSQHHHLAQKQNRVPQEVEQRYNYPSETVLRSTNFPHTPLDSYDSRPVDMSTDVPAQLAPNDSSSESRTAEQWESIYERAANLMRSGHPADRRRSRDASQASNGGRKLRKKSYPPTSYFPEYLENGSREQQSSSTQPSRSGSRNRPSEENEYTQRPTSSNSSDRRSLSTRETSLERDGTDAQTQQDFPDRSVQNGGQSRNSNTRERQQSRGRRLSITNVKNFIRSPSSDRSASVNLEQSRSSDLKDVQRSSVAASPARPSSKYHIIGLPSESSLYQRRSSSKNNLPDGRGIRSVAKSVFAGKEGSIQSGSQRDTVHAQTSSDDRHQHTRQSSSTSSGAHRVGKVERLFGQPLTAKIVNSSSDDRSPSTINTPSPVISIGSKSQRSVESVDTQNSTLLHSQSTTNFSEGIVTEDSSAITTPMQSVTELYHEHQEKNPRNSDHVYGGGDDFGAELDDAFMMTNAVSVESSRPPRTPHPRAKAPVCDSPTVPALPALTHRQQTSSTHTTGDTVTNKPSITRSFSTPDVLQQDLSFLPALKHQPLPNSSKQSKVNNARLAPQESRQQPLVSTSIDHSHPKLEHGISQKLPASSNYLQSARQSMPRPLRPAPALPNAGANVEPIAKMFVVCCSCKYFHDMPSKIYECMARSENVVEDKDLGVSGVISTSVRCPWCAHGMTTACCAGYAAVVLMKEKLH